MAADAPPISSAPGGGDARRTLPGSRTSPWPVIAGFAATRFAGNLFVRFPYVFITQIAKGLGVDVRDLTFVFGARELGGLIAPLTGRLVDRGHITRVVGAGGVIAGLSCVAASTTHFGLFVIVMVIGGAAKISIDLAQNAWIGHHVPLERRGRVIGVIEMTWAGAFLVGIPLLAFIIDSHGWRAAFVVTGPAMALAAIVSARQLHRTAAPVIGESALSPDDVPVLRDPPATSDHSPARGKARSRLRTGVWVFCFLQPMAQMLIFAVNGDWFAQSLELSTWALGIATLMLGIAELVGTIITVWLTDRVGPVRCGMWGMALAVPPLAAIALVGTNAVVAIGLMFLMDVAIEFAFVAVLPIVSELDVDNRGKALSHVFVLIMVARAIGSGIAGIIYTAGGFNASIVAACLACLGAAAAMAWGRTGTGSFA